MVYNKIINFSLYLVKKEIINYIIFIINLLIPYE